MKKRSKKNKQPRCIACGEPATMLVRCPLPVHFCNLCGDGVALRLANWGFSVGSPGREALQRWTEKFISQCKTENVCVFIWFATSEEEYERGKELGMIGGWDSWSHYIEHHSDLLHKHREFIQLIETTPDKILEALVRYGLPNTPQGRCEAYKRMKMEEPE